MKTRADRRRSEAKELKKRIEYLNELLEIKDKVIINITKDINKICLENFNLKSENEKLRKEKSSLSSELQALTEMYNECKKENDDLKGKKEKSKTMCDECELQHKECHCDCAREFIPKDKMERNKDKVEMVKSEEPYISDFDIILCGLGFRL